MTITLRLIKGSKLTHAELDGNFTDLDTRVNGKAATVHGHVAADINDSTSQGRAILTGTNAAVESAYNAQVAVVSQAEAEAGIATTVRRWTAQRVAQAIAKLAELAAVTLTPSNYTPTASTIKGHLEGIDTALASAGGTGGLIATDIKTSDYTAAVRDAVRTDSTGGSFNVFLPANPADKAEVAVEDTADAWPTNPVGIFTTDGSTIAGFSGSEGGNLSGGNYIRLRYDSGAANWDVINVTGADTAGVVISEDLDFDGFALIDFTLKPVPNVSGTLTQAAHGGRPCLITGTTTVPVAGGFTSMLVNKSGSSQTVQPATGSLIHEGTTKASISLPTNRVVEVWADGTDVWVFGALA